MSYRFSLFLILTLLLVALLIRSVGVGYGSGIGFTYPDETKIVHRALRFASGDLNPHWFIYPSFMMYQEAALLGATFAAGMSAGWFQSPHDFEALFFTSPGTIYSLARWLSLAWALFTIATTFLIGKRLAGAQVGLLAAAMLTLSPLHVEYSHRAVTDVPMTALMLLSVGYGLKACSSGHLRWFIVAGLTAGLAASTKYPGGVAAAIIPLAFFARWPAYIRQRVSMAFDRRLWLGLLALPIGFALGTPFALLAAPEFAYWLRELVRLNSASPPLPMSGWQYYLVSLAKDMGILWMALACLGCVLFIIKHKPQNQIPVFLGVPAFYYALIATNRSGVDRYVLPVIPVFSLLAAYACSWIGEQIANQRPGLSSGVYSVGIAVLALLYPGSRIASDVATLLQPDSREQIVAWVEGNLPCGSRILVEEGIPLRQSSQLLAEELARAQVLGALRVDQLARQIVYQSQNECTFQLSYLEPLNLLNLEFRPEVQERRSIKQYVQPDSRTVLTSGYDAIIVSATFESYIETWQPTYRLGHIQPASGLGPKIIVMTREDE